MKVGIIGYGKMGKIRHDAIISDGRSSLYAVVEPNEIATAKLSSNIKKYTTPEELVADKQIEIVYICTPNYLNKPLTELVLKTGKHVFCEKPPAFTGQEMKEIIEIENNAKNIKLMYGFNHRHHESVKKSKELIDSGKYGKLLWIRGRYGKSVTPDFYDNWRSKKKLAGGGIMMDQGIHMLDLFLMYAGDFEEVQALISNLYWKLEIEDNVFAIFKNKEGVAASLHSTMTQWRHLFSIEIFLERGYHVINGLKTTSGTYGEEVLTVTKNRSTAPAATWNDEEHFHFKIDTSWSSEIKHFMDAIIENKPITVGSSQDAHKLMCIIDKIYAHTKKPDA